jgi:hypothetical protein
MNINRHHDQQNYLLIDYNNIIKPNNFNNLFKYIKSPYDFLNIDNIYHIGLILFFKNNKTNIILNNIEKGLKRIKYIDTIELLENINDYCYFLYDNNKKIIQIIYTSNHTDILYNKIFECLLYNIPNDVTIWLNIDINNKNIKKYINIGFNNAYIYNKSPFDIVYKNLQIFFYRLNDKNTKYISYEELIDIINLYDKPCNIFIKFSKNTIEYMKKLSYTGNTWNKDTHNISQKEIAGSFSIYIKKPNYYILKINKNSINYGDEEGVNIVESRYNFHTHPINAYIKYNVELGYPSVHDYIGFMKSSVIYKTILHIVITIEGIYILSLDKNSLNININNKIIKFIKNNFNIKYKKGDIINDYINKINNIKYNKQQLINLQFLSWHNINKKFKIFYPNYKNNCLVKEDNINNIEFFYKKK